MQKRSFARAALALLSLGALAAEAAELPKPVVQISQDAKLPWRAGTYSMSPLLESKGTGAARSPLAHLFEEERDRSTVVITDTPWRRGGIMTMGMRLEF